VLLNWKIAIDIFNVKEKGFISFFPPPTPAVFLPSSILSFLALCLNVF
jgi:hypothetical protein